MGAHAPMALPAFRPQYVRSCDHPGQSQGSVQGSVSTSFPSPHPCGLQFPGSSVMKPTAMFRRRIRFHIMMPSVMGNGSFERDSKAFAMPGRLGSDRSARW